VSLDLWDGGADRADVKTTTVDTGLGGYGLRLIGRVPSELENALDYTAANGHDLRYSQRTDPSSPALGTMQRAQRAEDVVLSRPVFVAAE
jgi:hypothetical protein